MSSPRAPLIEIAQDWITVRQLADAPNTVEAKMDDLARLAISMMRLRGREPEATTYPEALGGLTTTDVDPEIIVKVIADIADHYERSTAARSLSTLRVWCRWMTKKGYLETNPCDDDDIRLPRLDLQDGDFEEVHAFSADEVSAMLRAAQQPRQTLRSAWPTRDVAIVQTLAGCGVRASELVSLQIRHVDRSYRKPMLRVVAGTKGSKPRTVPIPRDTVGAIDAYLADRSERHGPPTARGALFVRRTGEVMNRVMLDRLVRRVAADAGVTTPEDAATHAFRHFFGVQLARAGLPVPTLQQLMGHADSRTTARYTKMSGDDLAEDLEEIGWI